MVDGILDGLRWLGIDWDEGPYFQSQRMELYRAAAQRLVDSGHAYYCFCTKEELEQRRAQAQAEGRRSAIRQAVPQSSRPTRRGSASGRRGNCAIRFAVPEGGSTAFDDAVFGRVEFANTEIEDFVLLRSDGVPTYHLSVVVDDLEMRMTHVVRGADHLSNTPKQMMLYEAIGVAPAGVCARAADPRAGQDAAQQTSRRDQRDRLQGRGHRAGGVPQFSCAAGMDAARLDARRSWTTAS